MFDFSDPPRFAVFDPVTQACVREWTSQDWRQIAQSLDRTCTSPVQATTV